MARIQLPASSDWFGIRVEGPRRSVEFKTRKLMHPDQQRNEAVHKYEIIGFLIFVLGFLILSSQSSVTEGASASAPSATVTLSPVAYLPLAVSGSNFTTASPSTPTPSPTEPPGPNPSPSPTGTPTSSSDSWPMLAANPQRTSWTQEEVRGNVKVAWYRPIEPYIPYKVQPIAANGMIYVSTARGLYAFSAADGSQMWVHSTELPLGQSPTIATVNGKSTAFVGGYDHKIHAVNAYTGQDVAGYTPYEAGAGFETNPLVIQDAYTNNVPTIFAGNRDGYFYALDATTGALKWKFQTAGPILFSAAYKGGAVYFASNDNNTYALDASNGSQIWKTGGFQGAGFHTFWPVIYSEKSSGRDYVIFTGSSNYRFMDNNNAVPYSTLLGLDQRYLWGSCFDTGTCPTGILWPTGSDTGPGTYWGHDASTIDTNAIISYFENLPERHRVFVLEAYSGQEYTFDSNKNGKSEFIPITWPGGASISGNKYPPVISGADDVYYQDIMFNENNWISGGGVVGWKWGTNIVSRVDSNIHAVDEPLAYSGGGRLIYWNLCCDREAGAFDVTVPYGQANRSWQYWGYSLLNLAPDYDTMYNDGDTTRYADGNGFQIFAGKNQSKNGVYAKHMTAQSPPIPYNGKVYFLKGNALLALSPTGGATELPLATIVTTQDSPTPPTKAQLTQQLESEVQKMLTAGHLRPGYYNAGFMDLYGDGGYTDERTFGELFDYFQNPSDTVYSLLLAYPYLSPSTQSQVKSYLQTYYGPGATYDFTKIVHIGWGTGAQREVFITPQQAYSVWGSASYKPPLNPSTQPICGWCGYWHNFPPFSFYAAWKYAQIVGNNDPTFAKTIFNLMSSKIEAPPTDSSGNITPFIMHKPYFLNLYAAGYLGYLNLKRMAGLGDDATVRGYYNQVLSARVANFLSVFKDTYYWGPNSAGYGNGSGPGYNRVFAVARNFMFLTPEIADYMNQNIPASVLQTALNEYQYVAPYWFVSELDTSVGESTMQHLYDYPALFQAKVWVLKQPYSEAVKWLDVPSFPRGDLFFIQNLVAALSAG